MKDGGRMTFLPDLISSELLVVVKSTQLTIRMISGHQVTVRVLQRLDLDNSHVFCEFEDGE